jgi:hypothetical protein
MVPRKMKLTKIALRVAFVETLNDIIQDTRHTTSHPVNITPKPDGTILIERKNVYSVLVKPHEVLYYWKYESLNDPSDKDHGYAFDPLDQIIDSISNGDPTNKKLWEKFASTPVKPLLDTHNKYIDQLHEDAALRRWNTQKIETDAGLPALSFEIGEQFKGEIGLAQIVYDYELRLHGHPELTKKGTSDSVIQEINHWINSPQIAPIYNSLLDTLPQLPHEPESSIPTKQTIRQKTR